MERISGFSNLMTGVLGAVLIAAAFFINDPEVTAVVRFGYFFVGALFIVLCVYVLEIDSLPNPNCWQVALRGTSVGIGVLFVILLIVITWFVIELLKAVTKAVSQSLGGG